MILGLSIIHSRVLQILNLHISKNIFLKSKSYLRYKYNLLEVLTFQLIDIFSFLTSKIDDAISTVLLNSLIL